MDPRDLHVLKCDTHEHVFSPGPLIVGPTGVSYLLSTSLFQRSNRTLEECALTHAAVMSPSLGFALGFAPSVQASRSLVLFVAAGVVCCCGG